ncbi:MAG: hypothetical protein R3F60_21685 [bacterium]
MQRWFVSVLLAIGCSAAPPGPASQAAPGRKPDYVRCDPAHPELPCTPDEAEAPEPPPSPVKPDFLPCDPDHPERPCTPVPQRPEEPGVKPHFVPCDPAHPERPCTPVPDAPTPP